MHLHLHSTSVASQQFARPFTIHVLLFPEGASSALIVGHAAPISGEQAAL
jgi:hypothetical protein